MFSSSQPEKDELEELAELLTRREQGATEVGEEAEKTEEAVAAWPALTSEVREVKSYTLAETCSLLNLSPYTLRGMMADYGDLLGLPADEETPFGERRLSDWSFRLLKEAVTLRATGLSREEIRDRLRALAESAVGLALVPGYDGSGSPWALRYVDRATARDLLLIEKLERLSEQLSRSERKRAEDRDRLLLALLRTQQELQQLRYELVARGSRRERKRKGFWARLFRR